MNRRSNKILRELILGNRQNILELVTKYNLQERTIRADIKDLNNTLQEYSLPLIVITGNDIVNIGLHFILKNVRPYAAPCSEA